MRKQNNKQSLVLSDSNQKLKELVREEETACKAFQVDNFYTGQQINISELKKRIQLFKGSHGKQTPEQPKRYATPQKASVNESFKESPIVEYQKSSTAKFINPPAGGIFNGFQNNEMMQDIKQKLRYKQTKSISQMPSGRHKKREQDQYHLITMDKRKEEQYIKRERNYYRIKEKRLGTQVSNNRTVYGKNNHVSVQTTALQSLHDKGVFRMLRMKTDQKCDYSKVSESSAQQSWDNWGLEHSIPIRQSKGLLDLEKDIHIMWEHYQLLSKILIGLRNGIQRQKGAIANYIQDVCSNRFQFIKQFLDQIGRRYVEHRKEAAFVKRLKRAVLMTRLLQNLAIVFVGLQICLQQKIDSNLVNFVGYATSNIVFMIRLLDLCHQVSPPLYYSSQTQQIITVISSFEVGSYGARLQKLGEMIIRMEQNNQIIHMVLNKLIFKMNKLFQQRIHSFIKKQDIEASPLLQYAHYLFQFLASYLAKLNVYGQFAAIEIAPAPYLICPKGYTLVIEPWEVLFANKGKATFIRAYTEVFLKSVSPYCNIVYWTDQLPEQIDDLIERLPTASVLYRYHCRYEKGLFVKQLQRMGSDQQNTIIIDRTDDNFRHDKQMGLSLPWKGMRKDTKLMTLWEQLQPILRDNKPLKKSFQLLKSHMLARSPPRKLRHIGVRQMYTSQNQEERSYPRQLPAQK